MRVWPKSLLFSLLALSLALPTRASPPLQDEHLDLYGHTSIGYKNLPDQPAVWEVTRLRLNLDGTYPRWDFRIRGDYTAVTDTVKASEGWLTYKPSDGLSVSGGRVFTPIGYTTPGIERFELIRYPTIAALPYYGTGFVAQQATENTDFYLGYVNGTNSLTHGKLDSFSGRARFREGNFQASGSFYQGGGQELWSTDLQLPFSKRTYLRGAAVWDKGSKSASGWYLLGVHQLDHYWQLCCSVDDSTKIQSPTVTLGVNYDLKTQTKTPSRLMLNLVHDGDDTTVLTRFQWSF